jgi:hypothetical protein
MGKMLKLCAYASRCTREGDDSSSPKMVRIANGFCLTQHGGQE